MPLTQRDTNILKGIAIIAMLLHHIYVCPPDGYGPFGPVLTFLGDLGKCCVAMFLFCSGYGLSVKFSKIDNIGFKSSVKFIARRLLKFYLNYWFIFLIFVPLGVFAFNIPLTARYGENVNLIKRLALDILGLQGFNSYNITWWFNKLIILLYITFPILYLLIEKINWWILPISLIVSKFNTRLPELANYYNLAFWQLPFIIGLLYRKNESAFGKFAQIVEKRKVAAIIIALTILAFTIICRMYPIIPHYTGGHWDAYIAVLLAVITSIALNKSKASSAMAFLGRHSSNIYMIHTFIGGYWFSNLLYHKLNLWGGVTIIFIEMGICLAISMLLEMIKTKIHYSEIIR